MVRRGIFVTQHAIERFQQRVAPVSVEEAVEQLSSDVIVCAANFGARFVRLPGRQRVVLDAGSVVTVLPPGARI